MTTERDIAVRIAEGKLPSPSQFLNSSFYKIRVSGTGCAFRPSIGEFVYRSPKTWLSADMCTRIAGVPLVAEHPDKLALDGKTFFDSIVGILIYGYVKGEELCGIARIIDRRACAILDSGAFDTSPGVIFEPGANTMLQIGDDKLNIEDSPPALIDHVALISTDDGNGNRGVWTTKPGADPGVEISKSTESL